MEIVIFGCGNLASAFVRGVIGRRMAPRPSFTLVSRRPERAEALASEFGVPSLTELSRKVAPEALVVLGVKPQDFSSAAAQLKPFLNPGQRVLSFMAGVRMARIQAELDDVHVIRSMPNLPFLVGEGMTVFAAGGGVTESDVAQVTALLDCCGRYLRVEDEGLLDAATAVSGTGPAYVFLLAEMLASSAQKLGYAEDEALLLVAQTFSGALELMKHGAKTPAELRAMVTSKGGTTAAAMATYESNRLADAFHQGVVAAKERSEQLSQQE